MTPWSSRVRELLFDEAPASAALAVAAVLGVIVASRVFGLPYLAGTSAFWSWPVGDAGMMLTGWEYFTHEPWHFPLAHTFGTNGSAGLNILYLDAIPLVAVVGKMVHSVFGGTWNPYGPWHLVVYVLQGVFAVLVGRRLGLRGLLAAFGVAALALSMHAFVLRFYHEGLNGHFVLLWALLTYLRSTKALPPHRLGAEWVACLGCAVLLHPYLGAMCMAIGVAAFVRLAIEAGVKRTAIAGATVAAGMTTVLFVFGYIPQSVPPDAGEFGNASLNLMSLAVPFYSTLSPWLPDPALQNTTGIQWDGANFLGFGVLGLLVTAIASAHKRVFALISRHKALCVALALLALYAPSNRCFLGQRLLWAVPIPKSLAVPFEQARATGRFFWPVGYALVFLVSCVVVRRFGKRGTALLAAVALFQLVDSTACWPIVRNALAQPARRELDWAVWSAQLDGASRVNMYPSYSCWWPTQVSDRMLAAEREIEFLAASRGSRTNAGRAGRPITDCAQELRDRSAASAGELRKGEVYVFFEPAYSKELLATVGADRCVELPDAFVCATGHK